MTMRLELTTRFSGITTSPRAHSGGQAPATAAAQAKAHLRYIDRRSAAKYAHAAGPLYDSSGKPVATRKAAREAMRKAIQARAYKGGKTGSRVAEKLIFSLPNEFTGQASREALARIVARLVGDSEAVAYGVVHTDRPGNLHCHVLVIDGAESMAAALARRPGAKRVRRRDHLRMNERGRPKEIRCLIASEINAVAAKNGIAGVEHRSFKDRGLQRRPGSHEGPQKRARKAREHSLRLRSALTSTFLSKDAASQDIGRDRGREIPP